jgi:nucleotide-binding universal stress UspA family protein
LASGWVPTGHGGLKDLVFGTTINSVRHKLRIPLLVVRGAPKTAK